MTDKARRRPVSGRIRALLGLGLLVGLGQVGTLASWTGEAAVTAGSIQTGTLDLGLNGALAGPGGTWVNTSLTTTDFYPGESTARQITVTNLGTTALEWTASAQAAGAATSWMQVGVYPAGEASNQGYIGARSGSCTGTSTFSGALSSTPSTVVGSPQALAAGASQTLCLRIAMPATTPGTAAGTSATMTLIIAARQP